ncbi:MAG: hypothetical protein LPK43_03845 [Gammaproteobacteria bacterium]|nr:hypothetical protein [Gammaproteobacteria bacterium]
MVDLGTVLEAYEQGERLDEDTERALVVEAVAKLPKSAKRERRDYWLLQAFQLIDHGPSRIQRLRSALIRFRDGARWHFGKQQGRPWHDDAMTVALHWAIYYGDEHVPTERQLRNVIFGNLGPSGFLAPGL